MPLWLPGQRDAFAGTVTPNSSRSKSRWRFVDWKSRGSCATHGGTRNVRPREVSVARNRVDTARDIGAT